MLRKSAEKQNVLERPPQFWVELLQTIFDLVMYTFPRKEVLTEDKNRKLWNPIDNHGVESLDKENRHEGTERYSSRKELFMEYMESDSGRAWNAKKGRSWTYRLDGLVRC